ncbi:related to endoglucanase [Rhynchosporium agropyri]|uniref:Cellulase n=1 Tax=Rhynchosporium agropyri TaxID=914238 RepID=A0A1E1KR35_9HELO|nr:related to endoglucanase [Rhynchosporium agropyri]
MVLSTKVLLALLPFYLGVNAQTVGKTTRYWDCCKASCSWTKKISLAPGATPVVACDAKGSPLTDFDAKSGCDGGGAFMSPDQMPWAVSEDLAYGFVAASIAGSNEAGTCCGCFELTFSSGPVLGKKMIVQSTNIGYDLGENHFDIAMPGGGFGIFNGCTAQWGSTAGWGQQYGGVASRDACDNIPEKLRAGCHWRFDWFKNADNPAVTFKPITCPAALTAKTGCVRQGEVPTGPVNVPIWDGGKGVPTTPKSSSTAAASTPTQPPTDKPATKPAATTSSSAATPTNPTAAGSAGNAGSAGHAGSGSAGSGSAGGDGDDSCEAEEPLWAKCGGTGYTGSGECVAGATCKVINEYYSQCVQ